ncbi:rRNA maturation RNase YbeY [Chlamydia sp. 17-3921]|uniref:rRNA maturation RNase YbeY n=1 Tax=Chlamydia sp. 17-3921 TaxID=2675798 RepID=UPI00191883E2|nr:rRNA maturation RNase YbeY [Chlamydia sp. 17-3921]
MKTKPIKVFVSNKQKYVPISAKSTKKLVSVVLRYLNISTDQVFVYFLSDRALAKLHNKIFSDPSLTDTITLPIDSLGSSASPHILGEAFISPQAAQRFLKQTTLTEEVYEEISRYLIHSLLHMLNFTDTTPKERQKMRVKENQLLCILKKECALLKT